MAKDHDDFTPVLEEADTGALTLDAAGAELVGEDVQALAVKLGVAESLFRHLTANLTFHEFMREVLMTLMRVIRCEAASILEYSAEQNHLFFRAAAGHSSDKIVKFTVPMGQGIAGHVAESRQPLLVSNAKENEKHLKAMSEAVGFETRNLMAFPIVIRGKIFGVIELINRAGEDAFTDADFELVNAVSALVAKAIEIRLMISWAHKKASEKGTGSAA